LLPRLLLPTAAGRHRVRRGEISLFNCAIICLVVALLAAVVSFGGPLDVDAAIAAQHIYFIAIGLFVVSAMLTILDFELSRDIRVRLARGPRGDSTPGTDRHTLRKWSI
jgi:uncharacterized membrane protein YtjA (UPF0391 family)